MTQDPLEQALRMRQCPGIYLRGFEVAKIAGALLRLALMSSVHGNGRPQMPAVAEPRAAGDGREDGGQP